LYNIKLNIWDKILKIVHKNRKKQEKMISIKKFFINVICNISIIDKSAEKRARYILKNSKIEKFLQPNSLYLDIGTGFGHIVENILTNNKKKNIVFKTVDPYLSPSGKVYKRIVKKDPKGQFLFTKEFAIDYLKKQKTRSLDGVLMFFFYITFPFLNKKIS